MKQLIRAMKVTLLAVVVWMAGWLTGIAAGAVSAAVI